MRSRCPSLRWHARHGDGATAVAKVIAYLDGRTGCAPGRTPQWWDEAEVASLFPDAQTMRAVCDEQPRLPLSYFEQHIPVPAGWDDRPCGYLMFGADGDDEKAADARGRGWRVEHMPGLHLHQLVDPDAVAVMIRNLE